MASPSSPHEPYPVELPLPDSPPQLSPYSDKVKNLSTALKDGVVPSSIDVHIRWVVESGSIVHEGEMIAQLYYAFHGTPSPHTNNYHALPTQHSHANNNLNKKKQRGGRGRGRKRNRNRSNGTVPLDYNFTGKELRSPSSGFLRVLYKNPIMLHAVQISLIGTTDIEMSVIKFILAAIEPCEHPAVVGGLCVVCGADPRANTNAIRQVVDQCPRRRLFKDVSINNQSSEMHQISSPKNQSPDSDHVKKRQILEKQKQVASLLASSSAQDAELGNVDTNAAIKTKSTDTATNDPKNHESKPIPAAKSTAVRSLSSLLSGATATQKLQEPPSNPSMASKQRPILNRPRPTTNIMSTSTASNADVDSNNMSKMTVSGGVTIAISEAEAKSISEASSKKLREEKKLCLVLDLDHTLLHATDDYRACRFVADELLIDDNDWDKKLDGEEINTISKAATIPNPEKRQDVRSILLPVELPPSVQQQYVHQKFQQQRLGGSMYPLPPLPQQRQDANGCIIMRHFIKLRPYLKEFFDEIQSTYQLSIYTAGTRSYAEQVALMICRHLVGAMLDEEGLNELRSRVKQKDDEFRRYTATVERRKQLQLAKSSTTVVETNKDASKNTSVSFDVGIGGGKTDEENVAESMGVEPSRSHVMSTTTNGDEHNPVQKQLLASVTWTPPRAKQKESRNGGVEMKEKYQFVGEELLIDPSKERNRLRQELEESEELEVQATDLRRKLFGSRIVSRTDVGDLGKDVKSLKRVFPCGGVMAAILDDREDVWANATNNTSGRPGEPPDNLLLVKPYHWKPFNGYADVNNSSGQDLSKTGDDSRQLSSGELDEIDEDEDEQLLWTADILRRLHHRYYSSSCSGEEVERASVPDLLRQMRKETFYQNPHVRIVFSGLIPVNMQLKHRPTVVRYAEELGAKVLPRISNDVTHVVAARDRSEKIRQARREVPGCYIVHTSWLMECYWSMYRRDVRPHHMGDVPSQPARQHTLDSNTARQPESGQTSEGDESEDDFTDDLEREMMLQGVL